MLEITDFLAGCLDDLESRIDSSIEDGLYAQWLDFVEGKFKGEIFLPVRSKKSPPRFDWIKEAAGHFGGMTARLQQFPVNEALESYEMMALQQYYGASMSLERGDGFLMTIRSNYGTCIMPSLFGVGIYVMPEETNTLPTNYPLMDSAKIQAIVDKGVPEIQGEITHKVFEMGRFFKLINSRYPKIAKYVHVMHPDTQGVIDICELIWGSDMMMAFYQEPMLVKALFSLVCDTYMLYMEKWGELFPYHPTHNAHWGFLHKGKIVLRSDSVMNISPQMYEEFEFEHQKRILNHFTGVLHFCGRGDHYIDKLSTIEGLYSVNLAQPEYNNMETILRHTVDKGKTILSLPINAAVEAIRGNRDLHGLVHCNKYA